MRSKIAFLATMLLTTAPAWAANFDIHLSSPTSTTFTPNNVDVLVGDTLTFINDNGGFHNARSDDPAFTFRCAVDCGANGGASNAAWTDVVTVPVTAAHKDVQFYCEFHGVALMSGIIHITNPVDLQSFEID
jgi:plastocyanin